MIANLAAVALPASARCALHQTTAHYLAWLSLVDYRLWLDFVPVFTANVERAACAIGEDDAMAHFLNAAPLWQLYLGEQAYAAKAAVTR